MWGGGKMFQFALKLLREGWNQKIVMIPRIVVRSTRRTLKCNNCGEFFSYLKQEKINYRIWMQDIGHVLERSVLRANQRKIHI